MIPPPMSESKGHLCRGYLIHDFFIIPYFDSLVYYRDETRLRYHDCHPARARDDRDVLPRPLLARQVENALQSRTFSEARFTRHIVPPSSGERSTPVSLRRLAARPLE